MPFIITEPQKIEGTNLGFSVYPYHFSFEDKFRERGINQKIVIFKLKDSEFVETEKKVFELKFADFMVSRGFVSKTLKEFVIDNPQYVKEPTKVVSFFDNTISFEKSQKEVKNL